MSCSWRTWHKLFIPTRARTTGPLYPGHPDHTCIFLLRWCYTGQLATTTFRATFVERKVVPLLQVFDGRSKTRNILPQQKLAKSELWSRAMLHGTTFREKLLLRVVPCNITFNLTKQGNVIHKASANDLTAKRPRLTHFEIRNGWSQHLFYNFYLLILFYISYNLILFSVKLAELNLLDGYICPDSSNAH